MKNKKPKEISSIKATGSNILVERLTQQDIATHSITLVGKANHECNQAYVLDIGPSLEREKWGIDVGDRVVLQGSYVEMPKVEGYNRELNIVGPHDIKAVLVEGKKLLEA